MSQYVSQCDFAQYFDNRNNNENDNDKRNNNENNNDKCNYHNNEPDPGLETCLRLELLVSFSFFLIFFFLGKFVL